MLIHVHRWKSVPENYILWARVVMWLRAEVAKLADAQDLKSVCRDRRGAETLVFCWRFGPSFWLALGALGWSSDTLWAHSGHTASVAPPLAACEIPDEQALG